MTDLVAARRFVLANARLLDTHRAAHAFDGASREPVLATLAAYRNADGGFGHGLEPDIRAPHSETTSTLHALEVLAEVDASDHPFVAAAAEPPRRIIALPLFNPSPAASTVTLGRAS